MHLLMEGFWANILVNFSLPKITYTRKRYKLLGKGKCYAWRVLLFQMFTWSKHTLFFDETPALMGSINQSRHCTGEKLTQSAILWVCFLCLCPNNKDL